jgi:hypothetical protein
MTFAGDNVVIEATEADKAARKAACQFCANGRNAKCGMCANGRGFAVAGRNNMCAICQNQGRNFQCQICSNGGRSSQCAICKNGGRSNQCKICDNGRNAQCIVCKNGRNAKCSLCSNGRSTQEEFHCEDKQDFQGEAGAIGQDDASDFTEVDAECMKAEAGTLDLVADVAMAHFEKCGGSSEVDLNIVYNNKEDPEDAENGEVQGYLYNPLLGLDNLWDEGVNGTECTEEDATVCYGAQPH